MLTHNARSRTPGGQACALVGAVLAFSLPAVWISSSTPASAASQFTTTLTSVADTYASSYQPSTGHGSSDEVRANGRDDAGLLAFNTKGVVPSGYEVTGLTLRLYVRWNLSSSGQPVVYPADFFNEDSTTDNNRPKFQNAQVSGYARAVRGEWVDIPLTAAEYIRNDNVSTFEVRYSDGGSEFAFASRESGKAPRLQLTLTPVDGSAETTPDSSSKPPTTIASEGRSAPAPAQAAGFTSAKVNDTFDDLSSIDLTGSGASGKTWYTDRPFGFGKLPSGDLSVSDSVLTINQSHETMNYGISTISHNKKRGQGFQYGYFEARLAYDPSRASSTYGWPSFWAVSKDHALYQTDNRWGELDILEAYHDPYQPHQGFFYGTLHDWTTWGGDKGSYGNHYWNMSGINPNEFHTYAALWTPGRVVWYFDGEPIITQNYSSSSAPSPNPNGWGSGTFGILDEETNGMTLVLGSGVNYPLKVDWVRVWQ